MEIVQGWIRIALSNNNFSISKNTYSLDLYDYANATESLFSPLEFKIDSKYKRQFSNEKKYYLNIVSYNNIDLL